MPAFNTFSNTLGWYMELWCLSIRVVSYGATLQHSVWDQMHVCCCNQRLSPYHSWHIISRGNLFFVPMPWTRSNQTSNRWWFASGKSPLFWINQVFVFKLIHFRPFCFESLTVVGSLDHSWWTLWLNSNNERSLFVEQLCWTRFIISIEPQMKTRKLA